MDINSKYEILPCLVHKVENCQQLLVLHTLKHLTVLLHTDFRNFKYQVQKNRGIS
jgi:hypothetical protein